MLWKSKSVREQKAQKKTGQENLRNEDEEKREKN